MTGVETLRHSGNYAYRFHPIQELRILSTQCIYVFRMDVKIRGLEL